MPPGVTGDKWHSPCRALASPLIVSSPLSAPLVSLPSPPMCAPLSSDTTPALPPTLEPPPGKGPGFGSETGLTSLGPNTLILMKNYSSPQARRAASKSAPQIPWWDAPCRSSRPTAQPWCPGRTTAAHPPPAREAHVSALGKTAFWDQPLGMVLPSGQLGGNCRNPVSAAGGQGTVRG